MIGGIVITSAGATPRMLLRDARGRFTAGSPGAKLLKASFFKIGVHWHREFLPEHFKNSAMSRYPDAYRPRKGERGNPHPRGFEKSYTGRKLRRFGHTRPLVYTGESRRLANIRDVRATMKGNRVVIHARTLNRKNKHSQINMREEATVINAAEERVLAGVFDTTLQRGIDVLMTRRQEKAG